MANSLKPLHLNKQRIFFEIITLDRAEKSCFFVAF